MRAKFLVITLAVLIESPWCADAQEGDVAAVSPDRSDRTALGTIFADRHAAESALNVHRRALEMTVEERFEFLSRWVLPNEDHSTFRLQAGFTPTHPAPPTAGAEEGRGVRMQTGGRIVAPALDLIDSASSLNKLHELRQRAEATPLVSPQSRVHRSAMLALIEMALGDLEAACAHLQTSLTNALPDANDLDSGRVAQLPDAVLLAVHRASKAAETANVVIGPAYQITQSYRSYLVRTAWQRHFTAAYSRAKQIVQSDNGMQNVDDADNISAQWVPVSILRARDRGTGAPIARWEWWKDGTVENLWSHDEDYLLFRTPLRGHFAVEGDVRAFGWRETQMLVAGKWIGPFRGHASYLLGEVGRPQPIVRIPPPRLGKMGDYFRYRTTVRDGATTTSFNGRTIHRETLPSEYEPWIAIRSSHRNDGGARDLRITGNPQVPEALLLSGSLDLAGWNTYFKEFSDQFAGLPIDVIGRQWQFRSAENQAGEITGYRRTDLPEGCHKESLLTYFRPMLEDGSIEYEFWYQPGEFHAHPALDRLCFLLDPDGVKVHWLTDGAFDRTNLHPDDVVTEPANRRGPDRLPLKSGAWNRLRLTLKGDTVNLELNDELVYQRTLEATNQRVFGLFHYADRTGLRVRKVIWKGDWPREFPPLDAQVLASHETKDIDERLKELPDVFSHDFTTNKLPPARFAILAGDEYIAAQSDGVHVRRPGSSGYPNTTIAPKLKVGGDFDITVTFDQFATEPAPTGKCSIMLVTIADNERRDEAILLRRRLNEQPVDQKIVQCVRVWRPESGVRRNYFSDQTVEANAGRLRLARRADRIYYLFAENDSDQFRIIGEESYPTDDLPLESVRLMMQTHGEGGSTSVLWKSLTVRAEALSGPAMEESGGK